VETHPIEARTIARQIRTQRQSCGSDNGCIQRALVSGSQKLSKLDNNTSNNESADGGQTSAMDARKVFGIQLNARKSEMNNLNMKLYSNKYYDSISHLQTNVPVTVPETDDFYYDAFLKFDSADFLKILDVDIKTADKKQLDADDSIRLYKTFNSAILKNWNLVRVKEPTTASPQQIKNDLEGVCGKSEMLAGKLILMMRNGASEADWRFMGLRCNGGTYERNYVSHGLGLSITTYPNDDFLSGSLSVKACSLDGYANCDDRDEAIKKRQQSPF
jgi:hypothetical protein